MRFDYLIIGGGSAGCVLANRLSADAGNAVALVEAGPDTPPERFPESIYDAAFLPDYFSPRRYWTGLTAFVDPHGNHAPEQLDQRLEPRRYEQARVMGGGSAVNAQIAIRGLPADYDEWQQMGADGWSWTDVLPVFRALERDMDFDGPLHGKAGRLPITRTFPCDWGGLSLAFRDALARRGIPYYDDCHADFRDGCFPFTRNNAYGRRVSAATAYLDTRTRLRPNLQILADCEVLALLFDGRRATGARVRRDGALRDLDAREVIVAAGALHTPALLMRAGIGPAEHLRAHGIAVLADRAGVGANLQDHPLVGLGVHLKPEGRQDPRLRTGFHLHMRWSSGHAGCPPQDMKLTVSNRFAWNAVGAHFGTVHFGPNKAFSRGMVRLRSPSPEDEPLVSFNLLSDERDLARTRDAVRFAQAILAEDPCRELLWSVFAGVYADAVRNLNTTRSRVNDLLTRAAAFIDDRGPAGRRLITRMVVDRRFELSRLLDDEQAMEAWIRESVQGDWHACGTCRMGSIEDPMAVTDPSGRVIGVEALRVADASLMPTIPCANTNLTTMMIGERIAGRVLAEQAASAAA